MAVTGESTPAATPRPFDRLLGVFTDVHPGEGARAATMLVNIFLILVCYYIIKTVREPLILTTTCPELAQGARHRGAGRGEDLRAPPARRSSSWASCRPTAGSPRASTA